MTSTEETVLIEPTSPIQEETDDRDTTYIVLREITSVEELTTILETSDDVSVFGIVGETMARDRKSAARQYAESENIQGAGYKAVAKSRWKTYRAQNVLQMTEED